MKTLGYAAQSATSPLEPFTFKRRALRPNDIVMEILYCGICLCRVFAAGLLLALAALVCAGEGSAGAEVNLAIARHLA